MKSVTVVCLVLFVAPICVSQTSSPRRPQFSDYLIGQIHTGKNTAPKITDEWRLFRTRIREGATQPPNFAGNYRIVEWGCGTDCISFALLDLKTGIIYGPPFESLFLDPFSTEGWRGRGLVYRKDSRLLVADGCPTDKCGTYYYEWTGAVFRLLQSHKHPKH